MPPAGLPADSHRPPETLSRDNHQIYAHILRQFTIRVLQIAHQIDSLHQRNRLMLPVHQKPDRLFLQQIPGILLESCAPVLA